VARRIREKLVDTLRDRLGAELDDEDPGDGRMTAHAALRTLEWVLESFGHKEFSPALEDPGTVEEIVAEFRRRELAWYGDDGDDSDWPPPVVGYVELIESVLGTDLDSMPDSPWRPALARFGAPTTDQIVESIKARTDFGYNEPQTWLIQHRIGGPIDDDTIDLEIDRFIAHWGFRRDTSSAWHECDRGQALAHLVYIQRHSLVWTNHPGWVKDDREAEVRAHNFLVCFPKATRYFSNASSPRSSWFPITEYTFDTGIIAFCDNLAGIWWHAEED
jgi:hypothetical protein